MLCFVFNEDYGLTLGAERKKWVYERTDVWCGVCRLIRPEETPLAASPGLLLHALPRPPPPPPAEARPPIGGPVPPRPSADRLGGALTAPPPPSAGAGGVAGEGRDVWGAGVPMTASERAASGRGPGLRVPGLRSHPGRWVWVRRGWRASRGSPGRRLSSPTSVPLSLPGAPSLHALGQEQQPARVHVCNHFCKLSGRARSQRPIARVELSGRL